MWYCSDQRGEGRGARGEGLRASHAVIDVSVNPMRVEAGAPCFSFVPRPSSLAPSS